MNKSSPTVVKDEEDVALSIASQLDALDIKNESSNSDNEIDFLVDEDYYVHIDVLCNACPLVSSRINSFMIKLDSYDPRRGHGFPTDLLHNERDTLGNRRKAIGVGTNYYELWKVRRDNFKVYKFRDMVNHLPYGTEIRLVRIISNDHEITTWTSNKQN